MSQPALGTGVRNVIACLHNRPARRLVAAAALATLGLGAAGEIASAQAADSTAYRDTVLA